MFWVNILSLASKEGKIKMKKWCVILAAFFCFILGMMYSIYVEQRQTTPTVQASNLDEQIKQYEKSLEEESIFIPYSQTSKMDSSMSEQQNASTPINKVTGVSHNNISKLGSEGADVLKTVIREVLRTIVRFVDQLISE